MIAPGRPAPPGRSPRPPAERRGERDRREPVQRRLEVELVGAVAEPVGERAQDRSAGRRRTPATRSRPLDEALPRPVVLPRLPGADEVGRRAAAPGCARRAPRAAPRSRSSDPMMPPMSRRRGRSAAGRRCRPRRRTPWSVTRDRREPGDQQGDQAEAVGDHVRVRPGSRLPTSHAEQRPDHHRHDVDEGPETGEGTVHAGHPRCRFQPILWTPSRRASPSPRVWSWSRVLDRNVISGCGPGPRRCPVKEEFVSVPRSACSRSPSSSSPRSPSCGGRPASRAVPPPTPPACRLRGPDRRRARP